MNYMPRLVLNLNPLVLILSSSQNYRCEPPAPGKNSKLLIMAWSFQGPAPIQSPRDDLLEQILLITQKSPRNLGARNQEQIPMYIFLLISAGWKEKRVDIGDRKAIQSSSRKPRQSIEQVMLSGRRRLTVATVKPEQKTLLFRKGQSLIGDGPKE
jgi:hypothetical protein